MGGALMPELIRRHELPLRPVGGRVKLTAMTAPCDCPGSRRARGQTGCIHDTIRSTAAGWERAIGSAPASRGSEHAEALASAFTRGPAGSGATAFEFAWTCSTPIRI